MQYGNPNEKCGGNANGKCCWEKLEFAIEIKMAIKIAVIMKN